LNALLEENLSITTPRPQTTRHAIVGLLTKPDCQVCLVDTPGVIGEPAYKLQENMMEAVMGAFFDADVLMVVTDVFSTPVNDDSLFDKLQQTDKPTIVCINKVDLIDKINVTAAALSEEQEIGVLPKTVTVEEAVQRWRQLLPNAMAILPMAASQGAADLGVIALRTILTGGPDVPAALRNLGRPIPYMFHEQAKLIYTEEARNLLPKSPPLYDLESLTDRSERFVASETIRSALFEIFRKEIPYCCEVQINSFKEPKEEDKKPVLKIHATVIVERESQKGIVVGKGGEKIKEVGISAREKLEEFFQKRVSDSVIRRLIQTIYDLLLTNCVLLRCYLC
jgi:GTP-binding protein Era